jgi:CMP-N-acetylneuraminic acid synthetase
VSVLALIPARGGSKGLPGKNILPLAGRSLVARAGAAARESGVVDRVVLSTDASDIAEEGRRAGIEVPFMRPASVVSVVELPRHMSPDYVMQIADGALKPFLPEGERMTRRQDARPAYVRDGTVYAFWRDTLERFGSIYGERCVPLVLRAEESVTIDAPEDWAVAERMLQEKLASKGTL